MGSGSTPGPAQTSTYNLAPEQRQILSYAMPGIEKFSASVPQRYQGDTVAGFTSPQVQGQGMALDAAAGAQTDLANKGAATNNYLLGDIWKPENNPALQRAVDVAVRPVTEQYQNVVRPALRDEFQAAGQQFGGSRRKVGEVQAGNSYMRNVGDTASKVVNDNYATNMAAQVKALGLLPQTQQAQVAPALTTSGVGDVQQSQAQNVLNSNVAGFNYDQLAPFLQSKELMSLLSGIPGASTTTTSTVPKPTPLQNVMGGAGLALAFL